MANTPNQAALLLDVNSKPIPQYFNVTTGLFEAITGANGATETQLTGINATKITNDGTGTGVSATVGILDVDSYNSSPALNTYNFPYVFNGTSWDRARSISVGDGVKVGLPSLGGFLFNETGWDRLRNNTQGTLLSNAARTAQTLAPTMTNYNSRGVILWLTITSASGTGGLRVKIFGQDRVTSTLLDMNADPVAISATGYYGYLLYPGATSSGGSNQYIHQATDLPLPRTWSAIVAVGDASSYSYSLSYQLIN